MISVQFRWFTASNILFRYNSLNISTCVGYRPNFLCLSPRLLLCRQYPQHPSPACFSLYFFDPAHHPPTWGCLRSSAYCRNDLLSVIPMLLWRRVRVLRHRRCQGFLLCFSPHWFQETFSSCASPWNFSSFPVGVSSLLQIVLIRSDMNRTIWTRCDLWIRQSISVWYGRNRKQS